MIDDLKKSITNVKGKTSSKSMENLFRLLKSSENSPKMQNDNSINFEKSNDSSNRLNILHSFTNGDYDFLDDEKYRKFKETHINFLEKTDNELLTNNLEFLLNEIRSMEKTSNEMFDKKIKTEENIPFNNKKHEIHFKETYDLFSFNREENNQENNLASVNRNNANLELNLKIEKNHNHSSNDLLRKGNFLEEVNTNKTSHLIRNQRNKEIHISSQQESLDDIGIKSNCARIKKNYGLNISIGSIKNNSPNKQKKNCSIEDTLKKKALVNINEKNEDNFIKEIRKESKNIYSGVYNESKKKKETNKIVSVQTIKKIDKVYENINNVDVIKYEKRALEIINKIGRKNKTTTNFKKEKISNSGFNIKNESSNTQGKNFNNGKSSLNKYMNLLAENKTTNLLQENKRSDYEQVYIAKRLKELNNSYQNKIIEMQNKNENVKLNLSIEDK